MSDRGRCPPSWDDGTCLGSICPSPKGIYEVRACHTAAAVSATFDEPNLVSCAGLVPVLRLAERAGLHAAAQQRVRLPACAGSAAANAGAKITSVVAGMVAGADSIDDLEVIRHGALPELFGGIRAPSTLGTFLRGFTWGNVRQLDAVARETLVGLSRNAPLLPGADSYAFLDVDSTISRVYGYAKAGRGVRLYPGTGVASLAGDGLDTDRRSGDRRYPAASGLGGLSQGRGRLRRRGHHHRTSGRGHRRAAGPDGLGVRQSRRGQRLCPGRGPVLDHHETDPPGPGRDRGHRGARLGADRLPARDLRRGQRGSGSPTPKSPKPPTPHIGHGGNPSSSPSG